MKILSHAVPALLKNFKLNDYPSFDFTADKFKFLSLKQEIKVTCKKICNKNHHFTTLA